MSKIIVKKNGKKVYLDALSPYEINEANSFLLLLQEKVTSFEDQLIRTFKPSELEYKFMVGEFLTKTINESSFSSCERRYVWEEINCWVNTEIKTIKDRSAKRGFYEYCYLIYSFGPELAYSFSWRQWSDLLDRTITTKDKRLLFWLKNNLPKFKGDDFRLFLQVLNSYLKTHDTLIFEDDELNNKYEVILLIAQEFKKMMKKYFNNNKKNMTEARNKNFKKYKGKYVSDVIANSKFKNKDEISVLCEKVFVTHFVDVRLKNDLI